MSADRQQPSPTSRHLRQALSPQVGWDCRRLFQHACRVVLLLLLTAGATPLAQAQQDAQIEPPRLCPKNGVLDVTMEVKLVEQDVQVVVKENQTYKVTTQRMKLRAYNLAQGGTWQLCDGQSGQIKNPLIPGPTFRLRKGTPGHADGDKFRMTLINKLDKGGSHHACDPARDYTKTYPPQGGKCDYIKPNDDKYFPLIKETSPACLHGDNVTNNHFHGFHISPQPHQDFVLLSLYPEGTTGITPSRTEQVGTYRFELDPLPYTQPEGTHWYHPHKHGSTALQVTNGMAGTFILEGPFDDWLQGLYRNVGGLEDKVLVVQQISDKVNFFSEVPPPQVKLLQKETSQDCPPDGTDCVCGVPASAPVTPSVNGRINPVINMRPGEIQRWRFVNAAVQAAGQLKIGFAPEFQVKQIAQDGVQFARGNYEQQPQLSLAWFVPGDPVQQVLLNANVAPGNRADFLVKAPMVQQRTCFAHVQAVFGNVAPEARKRIAARRQAASQAAGQGAQTPPPLLTVCVDPQGGEKPMAFPDPAQWPAMPDFLETIPPQPPSPPLAFSMTKYGKDGKPDPENQPGPGDPKNHFFIDNVQYCADCANHTLTLNVASEWTITNDSPPRHTFHIHTNPHQVVEQGSIIKGKPGSPDTQVPFQKYDPPLWEDTIALPSVGQCWNVAVGPIWDNTDAQQKCKEACPQNPSWAKNPTWDGNWVTTKANEMSVCNCCTSSDSLGYVKIRQKPIEFTGEFVLHCHLLGHEDRGMMQNVQVVCPQGGVFGTPVAGQPDNCGQTSKAAPQCPVSYQTGPQCAAGSGS